MSRHATTRPYGRSVTISGTRTCYLVRHAIAEPRGDAWPNDDLRPLTRKGIRRMRRVVRGLRKLDVTVDVVLTSPLVRAVETAHLLARGLRSRPSVVEIPALAPGQTPAALVTALAPFKRERSLALVGHEPDMGALAAWLIGAASPIPFRKGAVGRIDLATWPPEPAGTLVWFATPKILRGL